MLHAPVHANKSYNAAPPTPSPAPRRCACGGVIGPDGECATCRAKRLGKALQTRLLLTRPGDAHEQAAEHAANQVMRPVAGGAPPAAASLATSLLGDAAAPPSVVHALT